jgi:hypothetical protein
MAKYRGTAAQRRRINPGPFHQHLSPEPFYPRETVPAGEVRLVPRGMPLEHLLPASRGQVVSNILPHEKQPHGPQWRSRYHYAPTNQVYDAVPGPLFTPENGWVV